MSAIAIDGPAGAGKSTIAKLLAKQLGYVYVDTGAMYRAMAVYFSQNDINPDDENAINGAVDNIDISIEYKDGVQQVILNGENVFDAIFPVSSVLKCDITFKNRRNRKDGIKDI